MNWFAISKALAEAVADVAISYTSKDATSVAKESYDKHGGKSRAFKCEITNIIEVDALFLRVKKEYGRGADIHVAITGEQMVLSRDHLKAKQLPFPVHHSWKNASENTDGM